MALRWDYHGQITVVLDDDTEVTGFGRLAQRVDEDGGWRAEVSRLPEHAINIPGVARRQVAIHVPGGGDAPGYAVMPIVAVAGRGAGLIWLVEGDDPMPQLPPRDGLARLWDWLRWQWHQVATYRRPPRPGGEQARP